jgi:microsomal dipeptidase-like Zn-dependent dipeptidase
MNSTNIRKCNALALDRGGLVALYVIVMICFAAVMLRGSLGSQVFTFSQIDFTIRTGSDDLRKSSSATATLEALNGTHLQVISLKGHNQGSWDNNSTHKVSVALDRPLTAKAIGHIVISLQEHNGMFEGDDNWNVQSVAVALSNKGHNETPIMFFSGDPLSRLTGSQHSFSLPEEARGPAGTFNSIEFTIRTGGDDLRGDSSATATLLSANGSRLQVLTLKDQKQSSWGNNSTNTISLELKPPRSGCAIQHVAINLQSHDKFLETADNWNVEGVDVTLSNDGVGKHEFLKASGDPLQRLTHSLPTLVIDNPLCHKNVLGMQPGSGRLRGFVDLHTHPMANLGFGGKLFYGGLDVGSKLPTDPDCHHNVRAECMQQALGHDGSTHSAPVKNYNPVGGLSDVISCGDFIRALVIHKVQTPPNTPPQQQPKDESEDARGAPDFNEWPAWNDITHQKMWVEWIRRSYEGGLRVMVALAVNNKTLADMTAGPGDGPTDDRASADLQLTEMKAFVARHTDFMGIAYSPEDLERIVRANKLAVFLGVEIDNIGNFNHVSSLTNTEISAEVDRLFKEGVRYVFPIHLLDNPFGGTAVYQDLMNYSNYRESGHWWDVRCVPQFTYHFSDQGSLMFNAGVLAKLKTHFNAPHYPICATGTGQANTRGLTLHGEFAIKEMMRLGMLIDIDHMSELSQDRAIAIAKKEGNYPLNSGHNQLLGPNGGTERNMSSTHYADIGMLHGMAGIGTAGLNAQDFVSEYQSIIKAMGPGAIAGFGTDTNGIMVGMPPRPHSAVHYSDSFPKSSLGTQCWDYNRDGVAHYGMFPDYLEDARTLPNGKKVVDEGLMYGADYFLHTWKKCESVKTRVQ